MPDAIFKKGISLLFFLALACLWEAVSKAGWVSPLYFPPMSKIFKTFFDLVASGTLPLEMLRSLWRMAAGYIAAAIIMIPLGIWMGCAKGAYRLFSPSLEFFRPLPPPAIIPAAMLFLGIGHSMKIFVIFFACSFPMILNTIDGVKQVPQLFIDTARSFSTPPARLVTRVVFPCALPQIMSGLRTSLPMALIVAVLSEMIGSVDGIGHFILYMQRMFSIPEMYAGILMLGLVGFLLNTAFMRLDRKVLVWYDGWKKGAI